jgi:prepilin-type processing-associated H-X9-DG protein
MPVRFICTAAVVVVFSIGLVCLPACGKTTNTEPDSAPSPGPNPNPNPNPGTSTGRDPLAPSSPVFHFDDRATREKAVKNLKDIGFALHNSHDATGALPGGYADKTGKPGLSWRVAILPYIEQEALWRQFKLNEPWDSPANKPLVAKMPKTFASDTLTTHGYTFYRGFSGPNTWLPPVKGTPGQPLSGLNLPQFTDGVLNTIIVAEAYDPVIWTKPDELELSPKGPPPKLGGVYSGGMHVLFGDGSVRYLRKEIDQKTLRDLIQVNDGNVINIDK